MSNNNYDKVGIFVGVIVVIGFIAIIALGIQAVSILISLITAWWG